MMVKPFAPAAIWLTVVTFLSTSGGVQLPKFNLFSADKIGHAGAYAVLVWLLLWGIWKSKNREALSAEKWLVFALATGYGAFMEWVQGTFFPGRFFEFDDMLANAAGAFLAMMLAVPLYKIVNRTS